MYLLFQQTLMRFLEFLQILNSLKSFNENYTDNYLSKVGLR